MARRKLPNLEDDLLVRLCERFLAGDRVQSIADGISAELRKQGRPGVTREQIYPLLE